MTRAKKPSARAAGKKNPKTGQRIIEGLEEAIAWSTGEDVSVRVSTYRFWTQFALKFGFPPATLRNWEQGRVRPDTPARVLLAVIAKHPESVGDILKDLR